MTQSFLSYFTWSSLFLVIYLFYLSIEVFYIRKKNAFKMSSAPLTDQYLFIVAIRVPFISFIYFGFFTWWGHHPNFTYEGFSRFIELGKLPLGLLSLSIPFVTVVNSIHRTIQTDTQIREAQRKNRVDGFYNHRKNSIEILQNIPFGEIETNFKQLNKLYFNNAYKIYSLTFPHGSVDSDDYRPSRILLKATESDWLSLNRIITKFQNKSIRCQLKKHFLIEMYLERIHDSLYFHPLTDQSTSMLEFNSRVTEHSIYTKFPSEHLLKKAIRQYFAAYSELHIALGLNIPDNFLEKISNLMDYVLMYETNDSLWNCSYSHRTSEYAPMIVWSKSPRKDPFSVHIPH